LIIAVVVPSARATISFSGDTQIGSQFIVGYNSYGTFRIDGGSTYTTPGSQVYLGYQSGGIGIATVTGPGSQWSFTNTSSFAVGASGIGRLEVLNGGAVIFTQSFGGFDIVSNSLAQGTVVVDGAGSILSASSMDVGANFTNGGNALLRVANGGFATVGQLTVANGSRVELAGGLLRGSQFSTNNGEITGAGELSLLTTNSLTNNGRLTAAGGTLRLTGPVFMIQNSGIISVDGASLELNRSISNNMVGDNESEITLRNGALHVGTGSQGSQLTNSAVLAAIGGTNDFYGRITNNSTGRIAVTNHSVMVFHDDVTADGGVITVFPGSTAVFLENLTMNGTATLQANIAGTDDDTGFGTAEVVGTAQLAGNVAVSLGSGFTPQAGDSFQLLAAGSVTGSLGLGDMPSLPSGLKWDLDTETNRVLLSVVPGLAGDYNGNGAVDAADFVVWRNSVDETGMDLAADGNADGRVDNADLTFWQARFGNSLSGGAATAASVPEPGAGLAVLAGFALILLRRRKLNY
jgi:T5SS/PEP-CTERM-associated repeat protein